MTRGGCTSILLLLAFFTLSQSQTTQNITLTTKKGPIIGIRQDPNPATGVSYDAFIGIPYAEKPVRFQLPVAKQSWTTAIVTQTDGPACPQPLGAFLSASSYSEDCLFLNVYTPKDAMSTPGQLPVMAFIHGSAFLFSSSSSKLYGPDFLIPENVILVTMNYRLGANGFLTLGSKIAPGNLGLHDTLLSLQWIQDEISVFGGDPTQVTLFGQSAGSAMSQFHYLSSLSTALFTKVLGQSGPALANWGPLTPEEGTRRARLLAQVLNCNTTNDQTILTCLQSANISDIVHNQDISSTFSTDIMVAGSFVPFVPVIDTYLTADRPFFNDSLVNLMKAATPRAKPLMIGFNMDDGMVRMQLGDTWRDVEANLGAFITAGLDLNVNGDLLNTMVNEIRSKYFPGTVDDNKIEDLVKIYTDFMFGYYTGEITRYFSNITYSYVFAYNGAWSPPPSFFTPYKITGVSHGAELNYLFYVTGGTQYLDSCTLNKPNLDMRDQMVQWWTTFAKTGVPGSSWPTVSNGGYLQIDSTPSVMNATFFESQYYDFWANIQNRSISSSSVSTAKINITSLLVTVWLLITANKHFS